MSTQSLQRQYNEVVAPHYDLDPQAVIKRSLDRALDQLRAHDVLDTGGEPRRVLDVGMGTGLFLAKLKALCGDHVQPFGLDLAENMVEYARRRIPDLTAEVADAANLDDCFPGLSFDLVCTHFVTGFVPMGVVAPKIRHRLTDGGLWSLVGGTRAGFPALRSRADTRFMRWLSGAGDRSLDDVLINPVDCDDAVRMVKQHGFEICAAETFEPDVTFADFDQFIEFAYRGGWFTPIIEEMGVHKAGALTRWLLNRLAFPFRDHHNVAVVLARKARS